MAQPSPALRSELAPTGTLRVGINLGNFLLTVKDPATGEFAFRVRAYGIPGRGEPPRLSFRVDGKEAKALPVDAPPERVGGAEVPMPYSKPLELAALVLEDKLEAAARSLLAESGLKRTGGD